MGCTSTISKSAYDAVIFDLDGVVTKTAQVHAAAWKELFDEYLEHRAAREGESFEPFDLDADYRRYVDGKPRYEGVKSFLESRGIELDYGNPDDPPHRETVCGLGNKKNQLFHDHLEKHGVEVYDSTIDLIRRLKSMQVKTAIVSSSKNCSAVLDAAEVADLFDAKVDGIDSQELGLRGKPAPDIFLEASRRLEVDPQRAVVVEDAIAGVQAGRRGEFGCVIGVDRTGHGSVLKDKGADIVVRDLSGLGVEYPTSSAETADEVLPSALDRMGEILRRTEGRRVAVFLDYDGTLTPIVDRPDQALLSHGMRQTIKDLAQQCTVAVISGRDLRDVRGLVGIDTIYYAGSHGFEIAGPEGKHMEYQRGTDFLPVLDLAEGELRSRLDKIAGALVERKKFSIAAHYRNVEPEKVGAVERAVDRVLADFPKLRKSSGKKVYELQPKIDWHKGKALLWLLQAVRMDEHDVLPLYIGDDTTDEDAFEVLGDRGIGIVVAKGPRPTAARYSVEDPDAVQTFLEALTSALEGGAQ
jgi:alpha,alpha-trehalase